MDKDSYPYDIIDLFQMNRVLRHRLRNISAGIKMTVERIEKVTSETYPNMSSRCQLVVSELEGMEKMTERMDLLFDELPQGFPISFIDLLSSLQKKFTNQFPFINLEVTGNNLDFDLPKGNLLEFALWELIDNAGGSMNCDEVSITCKEDEEKINFIVQNICEDLPKEVLIIPPVPFVTRRSRHEGLGLSIVYRICDYLNAQFAIKYEDKKVCISISILKKEIISND